MSSSKPRFGIATLHDQPFDRLVERWRECEEMGFDLLFLGDHTSHYRDREQPWLDGTVALAAAAATTSSIRIGTLVSNPILRPPAVLAKQAAALDHLSAGRLELGLGSGMAAWDHAAVGTEVWDDTERAERFGEYVRIVDELLASDGGPYRFEGRWYRTEAWMVPPPVQRPRPPITLGGQAPTVRRLAAERADCWNTYGRPYASFEEILETTRRHNAELDEACVAHDRDPASLRRSLLLTLALDAWETPESLDRVVEEFAAIGIGEFVLVWPPDDKLEMLERARAVIGAPAV